MAEKARLSFNQITLGKWSVSQAVEGCVRHGIPSIALWRHKIAETGLASCVRLVKDAGLHVSSVCRGGMFPSPTPAGREKSLEDNYRAVDEAAALQADSLVLVVGGSPEVADRRRQKDGGGRRRCPGSLRSPARRQAGPGAASSHVRG